MTECKNCGHKLKKSKWKPNSEKCKGCFSFGKCNGYEHSKVDNPNEHPTWVWCNVKVGRKELDYCGCTKPEPEKEGKKHD